MIDLSLIEQKRLKRHLDVEENKYYLYVSGPLSENYQVIVKCTHYILKLKPLMIDIGYVTENSDVGRSSKPWILTELFEDSLYEIDINEYIEYLL